MVATDWTELDQARPPIWCRSATRSPACSTSRRCCISINADFKLDAAEARAHLALFWNGAQRGRVLDAVVGGAESTEFLRQSKLIADEWGEQGRRPVTRERRDNHFTVSDPDGRSRTAI